MHLAAHGAGLRIQTAKENGLCTLGFDAGQDGGEVAGLVGGVFAGYHGAARAFDGGNHLVCQALAVGGAVVNHGHFFRVQILDHEDAHGSTLLGVAGHHAKRGVIALQGVFRRGGHGDLWNACIVVHARGGNGGARVEVPQHAMDLGVCNLLRDLHRGAWVGLVVLGHQDKLGFVSIQFDALGVGFFQRQRQTIAHVFTVVGLRACQRGGKAQAHRGFCVGCTHQAAKGASECQSAGHGLEGWRFFHATLLLSGQRKTGL